MPRMGVDQSTSDVVLLGTRSNTVIVELERMFSQLELCKEPQKYDNARLTATKL